MTAHDDTEADRLLREYGQCRTDEQWKDWSNRRSAYLARKNEDADVATVRRVLNFAVNSGNWCDIDDCLPALDRIAERLRAASVYKVDGGLISLTKLEDGTAAKIAAMLDQCARDQLECVGSPSSVTFHYSFAANALEAAATRVRKGEWRK